MAQRNSHPRTPRSSHNLQDERLFTLSGGIPPEHFDELNYAMTQRGRRVAARAPASVEDFALEGRVSGMRDGSGLASCCSGAVVCCCL